MQSIVGTWKLGPRHCPGRGGRGAPVSYGGKALGRLTLTADGRMMSVVCDARTELPAGVIREYSSYCGSYTYDGPACTGLTRHQIRAGSAAIRYAGCASRASAWS